MTIYSQIAGNRIKSYLIIGFFVVLISTFFYAIGLYFRDPGTFLLLGLGFSFISAWTSYFYSDKIVLTMAGAQPADKKEFFDYYTVTENLSIAAGLPMPKLYIIQDDAPNAFATGRDPNHAVVAATTGLLSRLNRAEIEGVIAHELSHVKNYDILVMTIVTVLVGTVVYATQFATRTMWLGGGGDDDNRQSNAIGMVIFIASLILMPFLATIIQLAVSRNREYLADASGALLTRNPDALADALEKIARDPHKLKHASNATAHMYIENPFKKDGKAGNWVMNLFSTHPPVQDRIRILRKM